MNECVYTISMKFFFIVSACFFLLSIIGCKKKRKYVYPLEERTEIQRVCRFVKSSGTNRFMVLLGKIYPLNNDGTLARIQKINTSLEDAGYFCGNFRFKNYPCSIGEKKILEEKDCEFSR